MIQVKKNGKKCIELKGAPIKKITLWALALTLLLALILLLWQATEVREENADRKTQSALVETLTERKGEYDERSIVLSGTNLSTAKRLAEAMNAELRITRDERFATLTLPEGVTFLDIAVSDAHLSDLKYMSIDFEATASELLTEAPYLPERLPAHPDYTVTDTDFSEQTYLDYVNMKSVWSSTKGKGITVAVIDSGIDTDHPEFAGRISTYSYNASTDKIVKDCLLEDGSYDWSVIEDEQGHGTAVAGVLGASMDGAGIVGVAPEVTLLVIKAECEPNGTFLRSSDLVFGLYYAIERDASIVNMSFGTGKNSFEEAAQLAYDSDILCFAAAGNDATAAPTYPAADKNVIGVGALASGSYELAPYSNYGENVDMVAPGTTYTAQMGGGYAVLEGTSLACPVAVGAAALFQAKTVYPYTETKVMLEHLYASCADLGELGPDGYYGYGALDVSALVLEPRGKITFDMRTDTLENTEQIFIRNHTLQNIPTPERLYALFDGWYYDPQCTERYELYADVFSADLTLYANWVNEEDGIPFTYVELPDGTIEIRSYTGHRRYITIPDYIDGKAVTSIGDGAFRDERELRQVNLPSYLVCIRDNAFYGCTNLVSISIPQSVKAIGDYAFYDNIRLSSLIFVGESELDCIGNFAFSGCSKMTRFTVPEKVTSLAENAFYRNTALQSFAVAGGNVAYSAPDGMLCDADGQTLIAYPYGRVGHIVLPQSVRTVGSYGFRYGRLSTVDFANVTRIENAAFEKSNLTELSLPDTVTSLGDAVFLGNERLSSVSLGSTLKEIPKSVFFGCISIKEVTVGLQFERIGAAAFGDCRMLSKVSFSENSRLTEISAGAFRGCPISDIVLPDTLVTVDAGAFSGCPIRELVLPERLTTVGSNAFSGCPVQEIVFPASLESIGSSAFANTRLSSVSFAPAGALRTIGAFAFSSTPLASVSVPASVENMEGAFARCTSLTAVTVAADNPSYVDYDGVVYSKDGARIVCYPAGRRDTAYTVRDGVSSVASLAFGGVCFTEYVTLPTGVTTVCENAFLNASSLINVTLPEGLTEVGAYAFQGTSSIQRMTIPTTLTVLKKRSFFGCGARQYALPQTLTAIKEEALAENSNLTILSIPDSVTEIGRKAFLNNSLMSTVLFGEEAKITRFGYEAFYGSGIVRLRIPKNVSTLSQGVFAGCDRLSNVIFAKDSKLTSLSAYTFDGCKKLSEIVFEEGSALRSLQAHALEGMSELRKLDFGDAALTEIDNFAFRFCKSLSSVTVPEGVKNIGRFAFYGCTALSELTLPESIEHIGRYAFLGTDSCNIYFKGETLPLYLDEDWNYGIADYYLGVTNVTVKGDWKYALLASGGVAILDYTGSDVEIDLTAIDFGGDVVTLGSAAFAKSQIERILLPETLTTIQTGVFEGSALKAIVIPARVRFIGKNAFFGTPMESLAFVDGSCLSVIEQSAFESTKDLCSVVLPSSLTEMGRAVFKNSGITSIVFGEGSLLTEISDEAFAYTKITSLVLPDGITSIGNGAFRDTASLKSVRFGKANFEVLSNAFYRSGLSSVEIPANMTYIGEFAFVSLSNLSAFTVAQENPYYTELDGLLVGQNNKKLIAVPAGREGSLTVPPSIEVIGFGAFEESKLTSVNFHEDANVLSLGYRAFFGARNMKEIVIPKSVVAIDYYAFAYCSSLRRVTFAEGNALNGVYEGAFYACGKLAEIMLPDGIDEISDFAFYGCSSLRSMPIDDESEMKGIYSYAMAYSGIGGELVLPEGLIDIGEYAFLGIKAEKITVPSENARELRIGIGAFEACGRLKEITLPFIGASFEDDTIGWVGYVFGAGSHTVNDHYIPEHLKKLVISEGIGTLSPYSFYGVTALEEIVFPKSLTTLVAEKNVGPLIDSAAKYEWQQPMDFVYRDYSGNISHIITSYHNGKGLSGQLTLSESVTVINASAFSECTYLEEITIHDGVTVIEPRTFFGCSSLRSVTLPDCVTSIGTYAFYGCSSLQSIEIPDGVTSIGTYAFYGCSSLQSIEIPDGVTSIGASAFQNCKVLARVTLGKGVTVVDRNAFLGCSSLTEIENLSSLSLSFGSSNHGSVAYYALLIKDKNGNVLQRDASKYLVTEDGFVFEKTGETYRLLRYIGEKKEVTLPESIYGAPYELGTLEGVQHLIIPEGVTEIKESQFSFATIQSVTLPSSIVRIGEGAFSHCSELKSIVIPDGVKRIEDSTFSSCSSLQSVTIPDSVTSIGTSAFYGCSSLQSIEIPDGVTSIGASAFYGCSSLQSIHLPEGVTSIGGETFAYCYALRSIDLPESLTSIGNNAFYSCTALRSITIPGSVSSIGASSFGLCSNLESLFVHKNNAVYRNSGDCLIETATKTLVRACANAVIPDDGSVTYIGFHAFSGFDTLKNITIPEGVTGIGASAFLDCRSLKSIALPTTLTEIGTAAFESCSSLKGITIPDSVTSIGNHAFSGCSALESVVLPEGLTSIGQSTFGSCAALKSIVLPEGLTSIGQSAFISCAALESIVLPKSLAQIGSYAFRGCKGITSLTIPSSVISIDDYAFLNCSALLTVVNQSALALEIGSTDYGYVAYYAETLVEADGTQKTRYRYEGDWMFYFADGKYILGGYVGNESEVTLPKTLDGESYTILLKKDQLNGITSIIVPEGITEIGTDAFLECKSLTSITLPETLKTINMRAFWMCTGLASIEIPDSVTKIGWNAFFGCGGLTSVTLGKNVTQIESDAFNNCNGLIFVENKSSLSLSFGSMEHGKLAFAAQVIKDRDGNLSYRNGEKYLLTDDGFVFENTGGTYYLTRYMGREETVVLPTDINGMPYEIKSLAGITHLVLPHGMTEIKPSWLRSASIQSVTIPDTVTTIGQSAFSNCVNLRTLTIPDSVTSIGGGAFSNCANLRTLTIPDSVTSIGQSAFSGCENLTDVTLPKGLTKIGANLFSGCRSLVRITLPEGITSIESNGFASCESLVSITLPQSLTSLGTGAFENCKSLTCITLPQGLTRVAMRAFAGCTSLESVVLSANVKRIDQGAFSNCFNLKSISVDGNNAVYHVSGNCLIETGTKTLVLGCQNSIIPTDGSVTSIGSYAFAYCSALESMTIPASVTSIERYAFFSCTALTNVMLFEGLENIESCAFEACAALEQITLPQSVKKLGQGAFVDTAFYNDHAFWENNALYLDDWLIVLKTEEQYFKLKDGIRKIADGAYSGCYYLKEAYVSGDTDSHALADLSNLETLVIFEMPTREISRYFQTVPITLKNVVIAESAEITSRAHFQELTDITIFVERTEKDTMWDENFSGWNNDNRVVYGDRWIYADFFREDGSILQKNIFLTSQVVRQPAYSGKEDDEEFYYESKWDLDGDGVADFVPATSSNHIVAYAVLQKFCSREHVYEATPTPPKPGSAVSTAAYTCKACGDSYHGVYEWAPILLSGEVSDAAWGLEFTVDLFAMGDLPENRAFTLAYDPLTATFVEAISDCALVELVGDVLRVTPICDIPEGKSIATLVFKAAENLSVGDHSLLDSRADEAVENIFAPVVICRMGDVNLDGAVNSRDVMMIKQYVVKMVELSEAQMAYADVYVDGGDDPLINSRDAVLLQQYVVKMDVTLGDRVTVTFVDGEETETVCTVRAGEELTVIPDAGEKMHWSCSETVFILPDFKAIMADMICYAIRREQ